MQHHEEIQTVIIGAGQAGLSVGYYLARRGAPFVILEANQRVGDTWRRRWDSLRLFTPARFDGLAGMPFPASPHSVSDQGPDGRLPRGLRRAVRAAGPDRGDGGPGLAVGRRVPRVGRRPADSRRARGGGDGELPEAAGPAVRGRARPGHRPAPFARLPESRPARAGGVLIVGAGNSGSEIAMELARAGHPTWMSGRDTGHIPFRIDGTAARLGLVRLVLRGVFHRVLTTDTPIGRKVRPAVVSRGGPLIRVKPKDLAAAGVVRVPRTAGVREGRPVLDDGPRARRGERRLVYGIRARVLVDRPAGVRRAGRAGAPARRGCRRAGAQLRRPAFPVCHVVHDDPRRGAGRGVRREADVGQGVRRVVRDRATAVA